MMGANLKVDERKAQETSDKVRAAARQLTNNHNEVINVWQKLADKTGSTSIEDEVKKLKEVTTPKIETSAKFLTQTGDTIDEMVEHVRKIG